LGGLLYLVGRSADWVVGGQWPQAVALTIVAVSVWSTRALHLDGLADCADGLGGTTDRERSLAIMKDSRVGSFGVIALWLVLAAKWVALTQLVALSAWSGVVLAMVTSRATMVHLAARLPYARSEGGTGQPFIEQARVGHVAWAWGATLGCCLLIGGFLGGLAFAVALVASWQLGRWWYRRLRGVTGDLLGASNEIVETLVLWTVALGCSAV
jgi:adenosylcobinamide-GDP ribazoletransferase